jgi:hypothetical protein
MVTVIPNIRAKAIDCVAGFAFDAPKHLPFSDDVYGLNSLDDSARCPQRPWSLHGSQSFLDASVIRLNPIVGVLAR